jgi:hypothetical protein
VTSRTTDTDFERNFYSSMLSLISDINSFTAYLDSLAVMLVAILVPLVFLKIVSNCPEILHKKVDLGKKGYCNIIAHRGSREEGEA